MAFGELGTAAFVNKFYEFFLCRDLFAAISVPDETIIETAVGSCVSCGGKSYGRIKIPGIVNPFEVESNVVSRKFQIFS